MSHLHASRVGVHTVGARPFYSKKPMTTCLRCGAEWSYNIERGKPELCQGCRFVEPNWGTVPFDQMPVSDSNVCAFDEPFDHPNNRRRREMRARNREET